MHRSIRSIEPPLLFCLKRSISFFGGEENAQMPAEELIDQELMLNRFNRLLGEVMRGAMARNSFQPWEVEILMDLENCQLERRRRQEILRQYQRAVEQQVTNGPGPPMKLSEFLVLRAHRREQSDAAEVPKSIEEPQPLEFERLASELVRQAISPVCVSGGNLTEPRSAG